MIVVRQLAKSFALKDAKKLNEKEKKDPRIEGRLFKALTDIHFECQQGEVLGLLGANGAGKTTALRLLSTALTPDSGSIEINGLDAQKQTKQARSHIGFLSGNSGLYERLTGRENLAYFASLYGLKKAEFNVELDKLATTLEMHDFLDRRFADYSLGMKQKTAIARAVIHQPKVVIFDEPTTGLDIRASETVLNFIEQLKAQRIPVIFSTHHLAEVERLCDRIVIIDKGKQTYFGAVDSLIEQTQQAHLHGAVLSMMESE